MSQHNGSVYLDTPSRTTRRPPVRNVSVRRVFASGICAIVGLLGLSAATAIVGLRELILEPDQVLAAFEATLDDPAARAEIEEEVAAAIEEGFVGEDLALVAGIYGVDVAAEAERVSFEILDDPGFRTALTDLVTDVHSRAILEPIDDDIDLAPISDAVLALIRRDAPDLAAIIPPGSTLWTVDADIVPDLTRWAAILNQALSFALIATLGIPIAAALHPRRHRVAAWLGRWALSAGLLGGLAAVGLPYLGGRITGLAAVEVAIRTGSVRLIVPSAIGGLVGMGLVSFAAVAANREKRKVIDEGTAAALGVNEPEWWGHLASPAVELPGRDLIEAGRPLTNT